MTCSNLPSVSSRGDTIFIYISIYLFIFIYFYLFLFIFIYLLQVSSQPLLQQVATVTLDAARSWAVADSSWHQ
jgi:hypothetical protein